MIKTLYTLLFLFCILFNPLAADSLDEKVFVDSSQVIIDHNQLLLFLDGSLIPVTSLNCDKQGIYVYTSELIFTPPQAWMCMWCYYEHNKWWAVRCEKCNRSRIDGKP